VRKVRLVFMFPGQSSRDAGMLDRVLALRPENRELLTEASDMVGRDLRATTAFATNRDVQLAVFVANHLLWQTLEARGITAELSLGLSLGEYNHLVHIGCLRFADALRLVAARGAAYDNGPEGAMISVFPLGLAELAPIVERARAHGVLEVANLNSPQQHVLAGERAAIAAAKQLLDDELAIEAVEIEARIPMHCSRFRPASDAFRPALEAAAWQPSVRPYLPNVDAEWIAQPTPAQICEALTRHVYQPVQWRRSIDLVADTYGDAVFVEVGPRAVLFNLLSPRWRRVTREKTDHPDNIAAAFDGLVARLRDAA
jgi:[acyl-carrier-protein] S-malonyltransferase